MGTWDTKINGNDTFQDIYQHFFDSYNKGEDPVDISKRILEDFAEVFQDEDDRNNGWFGLASAQWETKSLDPEIYNNVKEIIESKNDLEVWKNLGVDETVIRKRAKELEKFLRQLSVEKEKPKRRVRPRLNYSAVELMSLPAPDGKKSFTISESYTNGEYQHTSSMVSWGGGGGAVFYFCAKGKFITASWADSQTLEIRHDKTIQFTKKEERFYFCGDQGAVIYIPE